MFRICSEFSVMFRICSEFSKISQKNPEYMLNYSLPSLQSQEILNRPVFVLDILKSVGKF
jgi:hypothetical protein